METSKVQLCFTRKLRRFGVRTGNALMTSGKQNIIIVAALILLIAIFGLINPNFLTSYNIVSMAQSLAPYAILALGVTFVIATGGIDLSIGTVCIACAVLAGKMYELRWIPLWMTIPVMILLGAVFGLVNGVLVAKLKIPAFIATLGTMMLSRGLSAILVVAPNIFYPTGTWFNRAFSNLNGFPIGLVWVVALMLLCMYLMYKNRIGRYILAIGSNEEATRLSGINVDKYKILAYLFTGIGAGIAAIFWAASFPTVAAATGNGFELDAIAGVYIGGTSAAGGIASVAGSVIGSLMLVVIRSGLNFVLAITPLDINATYVTYVLTGIIVVAAVLMDIVKNNKANRVKVQTPVQKLKHTYREEREALRCQMDVLVSDKTMDPDERANQIQLLRETMENQKREYEQKRAELAAQPPAADA